MIFSLKANSHCLPAQYKYPYYKKQKLIYFKLDFKSWDNSPIETKAHLQFCKRYLAVHNKASNMASRAELGKYPMIIEVNKKILNYLSYQQDKDDNSIIKQSLQIYIYTYFTTVVKIVSSQI